MAPLVPFPSPPLSLTPLHSEKYFLITYKSKGFNHSDNFSFGYKPDGIPLGS